MKPNAFVIILVSAGALAACGKSKNDTSTKPSDSASAVTAGSLEAPRQMGNMTDSASMPSMGAMTGARMMDSVQTQMHALQGMSPDRMKAVLPMHRQMVANMLTMFDDSMRSMNMPSDAAWIALRDSIRQDLVGMPDISASQLKALMPQHQSRVMRLIRMHQAMTANMTKKQ